MVSTLITMVHLIQSYFLFVLVNDECKVFIGGNVLYIIIKHVRCISSTAFKKIYNPQKQKFTFSEKCDFSE